MPSDYLELLVINHVVFPPERCFIHPPSLIVSFSVSDNTHSLFIKCLELEQHETERQSVFSASGMDERRIMGHDAKSHICIMHSYTERVSRCNSVLPDFSFGLLLALDPYASYLTDPEAVV